MADDAVVTDDLFIRLDRDQFDGAAASPFSMVGAVLRSPGALYRDLAEGRWADRYFLCLVAVVFLMTAPYGAILGMAGGGWQPFWAAIKLPLIILGSVLLCLPTFYVFNAILGANLRFWQAATAVLFTATGASIILIALAPIAWLFTVSTTEEGWRFLALLHLAAAGLAALFGIRFLQVGGRYLAARQGSGRLFHRGFLACWCVLLLGVSFQMAYVFRPLMTDGPFLTGARGSFVNYVADFFASDPSR